MAKMTPRERAIKKIEKEIYRETSFAVKEERRINYDHSVPVAAERIYAYMSLHFQRAKRQTKKRMKR